ncbi:hypothetical protein ACWDKQ_33455, partial [Saccharopolyspora sp. NPDC000995]
MIETGKSVAEFARNLRTNAVTLASWVNAWRQENAGITCRSARTRQMSKKEGPAMGGDRRAVRVAIVGVGNC